MIALRNKLKELNKHCLTPKAVETDNNNVNSAGEFEKLVVKKQIIDKIIVLI